MSEGDGVGGRCDKLRMNVRRASGAPVLYFKTFVKKRRYIGQEPERVRMHDWLFENEKDLNHTAWRLKVITL